MSLFHEFSDESCSSEQKAQKGEGRGQSVAYASSLDRRPITVACQVPLDRQLCNCSHRKVVRLHTKEKVNQPVSIIMYHFRVYIDSTLMRSYIVWRESVEQT